VALVDRATVVGLVLTIVLLAGVMVAGTGLSVHVFWQASSLLLVLGGAAMTTVMSFPGTRLQSVWGMLENAFYVRTRSAEETMITLAALAEIARRQGLLALDRPVAGLRDDFLKRAVQMAVDGYDPANIRTMLQAELESIDLRHRENWSMLESVGRNAPIFGMMGTLIGLVVMLGRMDDPSKIGPGMAVALMTTLYGLVIANVFCLPLVRKLSQRNSEELLAKTVALEGVLAIQAGEHPRVLAQRLEVYLPPHRRSTRASRPLSERVAEQARNRQTAGAPAPAAPTRQPQQEKMPSERPAAPRNEPPGPHRMPAGPVAVASAKSGQDGRRRLIGVA
jgi:chemotaxis protein MotA